jgi:selenide,water dikinase
MGGEVLLALNLAGFPEDLPPAVVEAIIRGGAQAVRKAGGVIAGGHTVIDHEPKYGLAVVGTAHPDRLLKKGGAMPGDRLYITKPVGTGLVTTALKENAADTGHVAEATAWMRRLNMAAGRAAVAAGATAATDVSGFGLAGHAAEMAEASGLAIRLDYDALPLLPGAEAAAQAGRSPGGTDRNVEAFAGRVVDQGLSDLMRRIVYDPQTSGGLLVAIPGDRAAAFEAGLDAADEVCWHVGEAVAGVGVAFRFGPTLR